MNSEQYQMWNMEAENRESELPSTLEEVFRTQKVWNNLGIQVSLDSNISEEEALLLYRAVRSLKPSRSVEVGLAKGISTLAILGALASIGAGHHVVIDPFQANYDDSGIEMVKRAGLNSFWQFHRKFAEEVIPTLGSIQFAFIDASHLFDLTLMEFILIDKKLEVGGVVGFHDLWMPSLQSVFRYIMCNRNYEVWHPEGPGPTTCKRSGAWKVVLRKAMRRLPKADLVFTMEFLNPWKGEGLGNLVFLRKCGHDTRHWTFHNGF